MCQINRRTYDRMERKEERKEARKEAINDSNFYYILRRCTSYDITKKRG